ncbi:MAG: RRXRR domain-containing protein [Cyanobacteriota bacterium]|nr:RRXRR domain-containing protein [Cyanobacteriota bacterium]
MPTTPQRARRWIESGKADKRWSDLGVFYVQLTQLAGASTQAVVVGVDGGKSYSGIGVQSSKCTLLQLHLILPFGRVRARMDSRRLLRRSQRSRRINRNVAFKQRNHRCQRFDNRRGSKLAPSIRASRQLEIRVAKEIAAIYPVVAIGYEKVRADVDLKSGRKSARCGKGFSPVMIGQKWCISELANIAPVYVREGWQKDGNGTSQIRTQLGLEKDKKNKSEAKPSTHAVDGIALACGYFIKYVRFASSNLVRATKGKTESIGYIGGYSQVNKVVSLYDWQWKRVGQFSVSKTTLIRRSNGLCVA